MKKLLACLFAIIILLLNIIPCFAASPTLSLAASDYTVKAGDTVSVTVSLSGVSDVSAILLTVSYNPDEFELLSGTEKAGGLFATEFIKPASGSITYDADASGASSNGGTALSMKFRVKSNAGKVGGKIYAVINTSTDVNDVTTTKYPRSSITLSCDHSKMKWEKNFDATCTETGLEIGTCTCGYSATREIEKTAHTYTSSTIKKAATCTETGIEVGTCTVCGAKGVESKIPATGHKYTEWTVKQEATAETVGIKERTCQNCGEVDTQTIPTLIEGIDPEDITQPEESSTEPTTEFEPIFTPEPTTEDDYEYETEPTTAPNGIFTGAVGSDIALIVVIALALLLVIVLVMYIALIIRQKKK